VSNITRWSPWDDFMRMNEEFTRFFGGIKPWVGWSEQQGWPSGPAVDVKETENEVQVSVEIPGADPKDLDLIVTDDALRLKGEIRQSDEVTNAGYRRVERRYGSFQRTIPFPVPVEHTKATAVYKNGILEVKVPKAQGDKSKATRLTISGEPKQLQ